MKPRPGNSALEPLSAYAWLAPGTTVLLAVSSYLWIHTPERNDFERIEDLRLLFLFFFCFAVWCAAYLACAEKILSADLPLRRLNNFRSLAVFGALTVPLLASFPVGSRDVFAYAFYGKMWGHYGANPYLHAPTEFSTDPWFELLQAWWKEGPAGYGPIFILQTRLIYHLTGDHLVGAIAAYKLANLGLLLLGLRFWAAFINESLGEPPLASERHALLWVSSPLILFEGLSSAHNDLGMAVLLLGALVYWLKGEWLLFGICWGLSFWYKWYAAVLLPVFFLWLLRRCRNPKELLRALFGGAVGVSVVSLLSLGPFGAAVPAILTRPLEIKVGSALFPTELSPTLWPLFWLCFESGWFHLETGQQLFHALRYASAVLLMGVLVVRRWNSSYQPQLVAHDCFFVLLIFSGFVVTVLFPWHLLAACTLGLVSKNPRVVWCTIALTITGMLSYFLTFGVAALALLALGVALTVIRKARVLG